MRSNKAAEFVDQREVPNHTAVRGERVISRQVNPSAIRPNIKSMRGSQDLAEVGLNLIFP